MCSGSCTAVLRADTSTQVEFPLSKALRNGGPHGMVASGLVLSRIRHLAPSVEGTPA